MKFNMNDKVRVRLTSRGREILDQAQYKYPYTEDEFGWSEWQMWSLMSNFGQYLGMGFIAPFEMEIEISEKSY